jgi:Ca2+-binding EF-hand superfamily protein
LDEHTFLQRTFKFFDIQNRGHVTLDQFRRTLTKIGVVVPNEEDVEIIFNFYDKSGDGIIDYKEFIRAFKASADAEFDQPRQPTNYNRN